MLRVQETTDIRRSIVARATQQFNKIQKRVTSNNILIALMNRRFD